MKNVIFALEMLVLLVAMGCAVSETPRVSETPAQDIVVETVW